MASIKIDGRMKVKTLKANFKKEFGATLRVYKSVTCKGAFADDEATLASLRSADAKGGDLTISSNKRVGNFEQEFATVFGFGVQVANAKDTELADNDNTIASAASDSKNSLIKDTKESKTAKDTKESKSKVSVSKVATKPAPKKVPETKEKAPAKEALKDKSISDPFAKDMVKVGCGIFDQKTAIKKPAWKEYPSDKRKKPIVHPSTWTMDYKRTIITKEYFICKYPVTQGQWKAIMGAGFNKSEHFGDDNLPVENVSWSDIQEFIKKLNALTKKKYRLPTEDEWIWAARGAEKDTDRGIYSGCDDQVALKDYAWFRDNSGGKTHPVGQKKPNELGLYDMTGNVGEVCSTIAPGTDGYHVTKGGCYCNCATALSDDYNVWGCPNYCWGIFSESWSGDDYIGFRLVCDL